MGFYSELEKKWYKLVESLDKKGIPIRAITDPIETAGLPSLPVVAGVGLVLLALVAFTLLPAQGATLMLQVTSDGSAVEGAEVAAMFGDTEVFSTTGPDGYAELMLPFNQEVDLSITKSGCDTRADSVLLEQDDEIEMSLSCKGSPSFAACITSAQEIDTVTLTTPTGAYAKGCTVGIRNSDYSAADLGWLVSGKKLFMTYSADNCPQEGQSVDISCNDYSYSADMEDFINDAQKDLEIALVEEDDDYYAASAADRVYTATVHVKGAGSSLKGIRVSATDGSGNALSFTYSNIMLQATTGTDGIAMLVIPENTVYYINAEDTGTSYATKISGSYIATEDKTINVELEKGFETLLTVLNMNDNSAVPNAYIDLLLDDVQVAYGFSDSGGKAKFKLEKADYTAKVSKANYVMTSVDFVGGTSNTQILLEPLDDTNSGFLNVEVKNAHGVGEPIEGVKVKLFSGDEEIKHSYSNDDGLVSFGRIKAGSYTITGEEEGSDTVSVTIVAGETTDSDLTVIPPQEKLKVFTQVNGEHQNGVDVEIYDITYSVNIPTLLGSFVSGTNRRVEFSYDKGSKLYLKASFTNPNTGEKYGPVVSAPIDLDNDTEYTIDVTGVKNNVGIKILNDDKQEHTGSLEEGGNYYVQLDVGIPYYDPQKKETYDSVYVEFFTGGIGDLEDIEATPILIRKVTANDFVVEDPVVGSMVLSDSYVYHQANFPESTGASKYIRLDIIDYSEGLVFPMQIPIHVRSNVQGENSVINYRVFWKSPEGAEFATNGGKWTQQPITIDTKTSGWRLLDTHPHFYFYDAWLSYDRAGNNVAASWATTSHAAAPEFAEGSAFYLQVRGKARVPTNNYGVEISAMPQAGYPYAIPTSYSGSIVRTNGVVQEIFPADAISINEISPASGSQGLDYSLDADDELRLAIRMETRLKAEGGVGEDAPVEIAVFDDYGRQKLLLNVRSLKPSEITPVSNLIATQVVGSLIEGVPRVYDHSEEVIPSYHVPEYGSTEGRVFGALLSFNNSDQNDKSLKFIIQDEHKTIDNKVPWARFYKQALPVYIDADFAAEWPFMSEKQAFILGHTTATHCDNLTIAITEEATELTTTKINCTVENNEFAFDFVPTGVGWHTVNVGIDVPTLDGKSQVYEDEIRIYVTNLPEMTATASAAASVREGQNITITATVYNTDPTYATTILSYTGSYGNLDPEQKTSLEPRAWISIGTSHIATAALDVIQPSTSTKIDFVWEATGGGPLTATVCAGYFKWDGESWDVLEGTENCDNIPIVVNAEADTTLMDLGIEMDLNATTHYKVDLDTVTLNATVINHGENYTTSDFGLSVYMWVTNEEGFPELNSAHIGGAEGLKNGTNYTVTKEINMEAFDYGVYTVTVCAVYDDYEGSTYADGGGEPECASQSFTIEREPRDSYEGEKTLDIFGGSNKQEEDTASTTGNVNIRYYIENGDYATALEKLLLIDRQEEPTIEKIESPVWTLKPGESDWTFFIGKGMLAVGNDDIRSKTSNLEIYLFESDADTSGLEPWEQGSFKHGWVDYDLALTGYDDEYNEGLDIYAASLGAAIIRKDADSPCSVKDYKNYPQQPPLSWYLQSCNVLPVDSDTDNWLLANGTAVEHILNNPGGYSSDNDASHLVIPYHNEYDMFLRYLPEQMQARIHSGNITVYAKGDRFVVEKTFTVSGVDIKPATHTFDFTDETAAGNNYAQKRVQLTVSNLGDSEIEIEKIVWNPSSVAQTYNLGVNAIGSYDKFDYKQLDPFKIPSEGIGYIDVTSTPSVEVCKGETTAGLEIFLVDEEVPWKVVFSLKCPGIAEEDVGAAAAQLVYKEKISPDAISTSPRACEVSESGGNEIVRVCDAEQFTMAVLQDAADGGRTQAVYALGEEEVTATVMDNARAAHGFTKLKDVMLIGQMSTGDTNQKQAWLDNENIGCGKVIVSFEKLSGSKGGDEDKDVLITPVTVTTNATWCAGGSDGDHAVAIGLLNLDGALRPDQGSGVQYTGFSGMDKFLTAMNNAVTKGRLIVGLPDVFGYAGTSPSEVDTEFSADYDYRTHTFVYKDWHASELVSSDWVWLRDQVTVNNPVVHYTQIVDDVSRGGKIVRLGLAYNDAGVSASTLQQHREDLAVDLVNSWTGASIGTAVCGKGHTKVTGHTAASGSWCEVRIYGLPMDGYITRQQLKPPHIPFTEVMKEPVGTSVNADSDFAMAGQLCYWTASGNWIYETYKSFVYFDAASELAPSAKIKWVALELYGKVPLYQGHGIRPDSSMPNDERDVMVQRAVSNWNHPREPLVITDFNFLLYDETTAERMWGGWSAYSRNEILDVPENTVNRNGLTKFAVRTRDEYLRDPVPCPGDTQGTSIGEVISFYTSEAPATKRPVLEIAYDP
ncbi:collagen binding domain-containing protein [archaeon]